MGEKFKTKKKKGASGSVSSIHVEFWDSGTIKCPTRGCNGIIFQSRSLGGPSSKQSRVFGTCALCNRQVILPKSVKHVPRHGKKSILTKSIELNWITSVEYLDAV